MFYYSSSENLVVESPLQVTYDKRVTKDESGAITSDKVVFTRYAAKTYRFVAMSAEAALNAEKLAVARYTRAKYDVLEIRSGDIVTDYLTTNKFALQAEIVRVRNDNDSWDLRISVRETDRRYDLASKDAESVFEIENRRDYDENPNSDVIKISLISTTSMGYIIRVSYQGSGHEIMQVKMTEDQLEWEDAGRYKVGSYYDLPAGALVRAVYGFYTSNIIVLPERPA